MNNSTITQHPEWHFTPVAPQRKKHNNAQKKHCGAAAGASPLHADGSAFKQRGSDVQDISVLRGEDQN